jgi:carbamoyl-phosphate synthase large subunit
MSSLKILLGAAGSPMARNIGKHLKNQGHTVTGMDCEKEKKGYIESFCNKYVNCPRGDQANFPTWLLETVEAFDFYIPFVDEELRNLIIQKVFNSREILNKTISLKSNFTKLSFSKKEIYEKALRHKISQPLEVENWNGKKAIYRPNLGRGSRGVAIIETQEEFDFYSKKIGIIQEYEVGFEYTIDLVVGKNHSIILYSPRRRIATNSVSIIGRTYSDLRYIDFVQEIISAFKLSGTFNIQIIDSEKGPKLIEINPRLAGSHFFSTLAGCDVVQFAIKELQNLIPPNQSIVTPRDLLVTRYYDESVEEINEINNK